jgi:hypothetical protein
MPGDARGDPYPKEPPRSQDPPAASRRTNLSLTDGGDPRAIGELLACWIGCKVEEVDSLVEQARSKTATIPDRRVLQSMLGELVVRVRALELDVAELKAAKR